MPTNRIYHRPTLQATERLQLRKQIETLFRSGKAFSIGAITVRYLLVPRGETERSPVRVGFAIPKKKVRKATARNRKRRLLRESWRLKKFDLYTTIPAQLQLHCFIIYNRKENFTFATAQAMIATVLETLVREIRN